MYFHFHHVSNDRTCTAYDWALTKDVTGLQHRFVIFGMANLDVNCLRSTLDSEMVLNECELKIHNIDIDHIYPNRVVFIFKTLLMSDAIATTDSLFIYIFN